MKKVPLYQSFWKEMNVFLSKYSMTCWIKSWLLWMLLLRQPPSVHCSLSTFNETEKIIEMNEKKFYFLLDYVGCRRIHSLKSLHRTLNTQPNKGEWNACNWLCQCHVNTTRCDFECVKTWKKKTKTKESSLYIYFAISNDCSLVFFAIDSTMTNRKQYHSGRYFIWWYARFPKTLISI